MRKATATLLAAGMMLVVAGGRVARAADRSGIGLEWSVGPMVAPGDFDMKFTSTFGVKWQATSDVSVGVFGSSGRWSGQHSYGAAAGITTGASTNFPTARDVALSAWGSHMLSGIRIGYILPWMKMLEGAIELGVMNFWEENYGFAGGASLGDFGNTRDALDVSNNASAAMQGLSVRANLLQGEQGPATGRVSVLLSYRFVQFAPLNVFGVEESTVATPAAIESVDNFNNISLQLAAEIGF